MKVVFLVYVEHICRLAYPNESRMANCRTEVRPTFVTLSPFIKGDAFHCRHATERRGALCSAVESKLNLRSSFCPPSSRGTRSVADKQRNAGGLGIR
jgi:hypothetical protein